MNQDQRSYAQWIYIQEPTHHNHNHLSEIFILVRQVQEGISKIDKDYVKKLEEEANTWVTQQSNATLDFFTLEKDVPHWIMMKIISSLYNIIEHILIELKPFGFWVTQKG